MQLPQCRGPDRAAPGPAIAIPVARPSARAQLDNHKHNFGVQPSDNRTPQATSDPEAKCKDQKRKRKIASNIANRVGKCKTLRLSLSSLCLSSLIKVSSRHDRSTSREASSGIVYILALYKAVFA